jgi:hypothetical protein
MIHYKVPNLLFVLMVDKDELFATIKHLYGISQTHRYFEKFLSTSIINLPDTPLNSSEPTSMDMQYRKVLIKSIIGKDTLNDLDKKIEIASLIFWVLDCDNYRDQNKIIEITDFNIEKIYLLSLQIVLRILKDNYPKIFMKLKNKELDSYYRVYELFTKLPDENAVNDQISQGTIAVTKNLRDFFKSSDNNEFWSKNKHLFIIDSYSDETEIFVDFISKECLLIEKPIASTVR